MQGDAYFLQHDTVPVLNLCFGSVVCAALTAFSALFWWRVYRCGLEGRAQGRWPCACRAAAGYRMASRQLPTLPMLPTRFPLAPFTPLPASSNLSRKRWSHRRKRAVTIAGTELTLCLLNSVFYILPNGYVLARADQCAWFSRVVLWSGFVRWTLWNT